MKYEIIDVKNNKPENKQSLFYVYRQNNSGGYYLKDYEKGIGNFIIIQATGIEDSNNRLDIIVKNHSNYCECCGERWYPIYVYQRLDIDGDYDECYSSIEKFVNNRSILEYNIKFSGIPDIFVHYLDGSINKINLFY